MCYRKIDLRSIIENAVFACADSHGVKFARDFVEGEYVDDGFARRSEGSLPHVVAVICFGTRRNVKNAVLRRVSVGMVMSADICDEFAFRTLEIAVFASPSVFERGKKIF